MIRILHFSDVHVQESARTIPPRELLGKRALALANLYLTRGRLFRESVPKLEALGRFAVSERVDFSICTGDYTAVGSEAEYRSARAAIESLVRAPLGFCTVPGNHDVYLGDTLRDTRFERHFGAFTTTDMPEYACDGPYPFVRLVSSSLAVVGVNSAKPNPNPFSSSGRIPQAQLDGLVRVLNDPRLSGRRVRGVRPVLRGEGSPRAARPAVCLVQGTRVPDLSAGDGIRHHGFGRD